MGRLKLNSRETKLRLAPKFKGPKIKDHPIHSKETSGSIEKDDAREVSEIAKMMKQATAAVKAAKDCDYYVVMVFASGNQARAFVRESEWHDFMDKTNTFVDGIGLAEKLGIKLPKEQFTLKARRSDSALTPLIPKED